MAPINYLLKVLRQFYDLGFLLAINLIIRIYFWFILFRQDVCTHMVGIFKIVGFSKYYLHLAIITTRSVNY